MPAQARQIPVTADDLAPDKEGGGAYATLEVPGEYEAVLGDVNDYKTERSEGWVFRYDVETPTGGTVDFKVFLSFSTAARWKLIEVLEAHDADLSEGLNMVDPNAFIGDVVGAWIDFPRDKNTKEPTSKYREIRNVFGLVEKPELTGVAVQPPLISAQGGVEPF